MTENEKYEIAVLAEDYANKKLYYDCLAMRNAYGKTHEESIKQTIDFNLAEAEKWEAWRRLERAKANTVL
jgi:hypothetical protein